MDNNNPAPAQGAAQAQVAQVPPQPVGAAPQTPPVATPPVPAGGSKKTIFLLIGGLVIIILIAAGIFWYMNRPQSPKPEAQQQVSKATPKPTPAETVDTINQDLNSIDVESSDSDFTSVDADLGNL